MYHFAYNFFDKRPSVVSAMTLLRKVHGENKRFVQLMQLKDGDVISNKSEIGNKLYMLIPKGEWLGEDVYFSLNTFKSYHRRSEDCVRLNALYTDLDCYKLGIDVNEARYQIDEMIANEEILTPNIIIYSGRGIQLIWLMEFMVYKTYLKLWIRMQDEIFNRFSHLNADRQAKSVTQVFRLAGSISSRTGGIIRAEYLRDARYSIGEMKEFLLPVLPSVRKNEKVVVLPSAEDDKKLKKKGVNHVLTEKSLNQARLADFEKLIEIQPVVNRKTLLFNYAICAKALGMEDKLIERNLQRINSNFYKPLPESRVRGAINSVGKVAYKKTNDTLIVELNITLEEQRQLTTIISKQVKKEREKKRKEAKRRQEGVRPKEEYQADRKQNAKERLYVLSRLMLEQPHLKNNELAELLSVHPRTISRMKSQLKNET
ncbi:primase C-terminal domain-containing protein [Lysinibacillus sp. NPDC095746]|uniref:primase C-terminal domain-containing protein n=1 Tax=Lysinibacillus sp. NPDC095746 TaxID=3364134 RepID=UPI003805F7D4